MANNGLINVSRLREKMSAAGVDVLVAAAPENTYYLSGVFIRTQVSIRDRLAVVVWPVSDPPTFIVCNIEESVARDKGSIQDVRCYVEFAQSPIAVLGQVLHERGLARGRIGVEMRFLTRHYFEELERAVPNAQLVPADEVLEQVRAAKTPAEIARMTDAFRRTEEGIRDAWARSQAGDTEKVVAERMLAAILERGADSQRHITLASGENTAYAHVAPGSRVLRPGDTLLTDFGGNFYGFSSDMARMGIVGTPSAEQRDEYRRYQEIYVRVLEFVRPGITAAEVYEYCRTQYEAAGMVLSSPHVGHSLTRMGGHENPMLQPRCRLLLEPNMLLAVEPSYKPRPNQRYHIEDLVRVTESGAEVLTDWRSTERMIPIAVG